MSACIMEGGLEVCKAAALQRRVVWESDRHQDCTCASSLQGGERLGATSGLGKDEPEEPSDGCSRPEPPGGRRQHYMEPVVQPVVLQVEVTTRRQAMFIQVATWSVLLALLGLAIALLIERSTLHSKQNPQRGKYYTSILAVSGSCLAGLLALAAAFAVRLKREVQRGSYW
jgi:hypothetical protein